MTPYEMRALHAAGKTYRQIAEMAGLSFSCVANHIKGNVAKARKQETTERNCMCCAKKFKSYGAHHRLCDYCKRKYSAVSPYAPYLPE